MKKIFLFPTLPTSGSLNSYLSDFSKALSKKADVVNANTRTNSATIDLLKNCFRADVFIFNWIENTPFKRMGTIQTLVFLLLIFPVLKLRKAKVYWVFHNFTSHQGKNYLSEVIKSIMMKHSDVIITHSKQALEYLYNNTPAKVKKLFANHPIKNREMVQRGKPYFYDILIWGSIEPYKGIVEFLEFLKENNSTLKVKVIGKCKDQNYNNKILSLLSQYISYENRIASFEEIKELIGISKFVLFPYLKQSVSSSGALMDTISFGGSAIGPERGSFLDMQEEGICYTFKQYEDVVKIVSDNQQKPLKRIKNFIASNTWDKFAEKILSL